MYVRFTLYAVKSVTRRIPTFVQLITRLNAILKSLVNRINVLFFFFLTIFWVIKNSLLFINTIIIRTRSSFYLIFVIFNGNSMDYIIIINDTYTIYTWRKTRMSWAILIQGSFRFSRTRIYLTLKRLYFFGTTLSCLQDRIPLTWIL